MKHIFPILCLLAIGGCRETNDTPAPWFLGRSSSGGIESKVVIESWATRRVEFVRSPVDARPIAIVVRDLDAAITSPRSRWLATESDLALRIETDRIVAESPAFPGKRRVFTGSLEITVAPDKATLVRVAPRDGSYRLSFSAAGNLVVRESARGVTVWSAAQPRPIIFESGSRISPLADSYEVIRAGRTVPLALPRAATPEQQMTFVPGTGSVRFFDAWGRVSAELPSADLTIQSGQGGLLVHGKFPSGLPGVLDEPFQVFLPLRSRHLLVIKQPGRLVLPRTGR